MKFSRLIVLVVWAGLLIGCSANEQGQYFPKKQYVDKAWPAYEDVKDQLPKPVYDDNPDYIDFYYKAWEIGFSNLKQPPSGSPLVSNFIDEAFNENIFLWDMSFSTMWANYAHHIFPGIEGLDNFYALQLADGEIVREIGEADGKLGVIGWSEPGTPGSLNHPILPWAEIESFKNTGDNDRLEDVYLPLKKYRESYTKIYDEASGLYLTDKAAMDDSPRNPYMLAGVDVSAEMVIFDHWLAIMAGYLEKNKEAEYYSLRAEEYANFINEKLWDEETGFYYDWGKDGERMEMKTIAAFWTMLAGIPDSTQFRRLVEHLNDPESFKTKHRVPTHPKNEEGFTGTYWDGAVWAPTNTMIIEGLEIYGEYDLAREIALNHLEATTQVYIETGTAWENYYPLEYEKGLKARPDFIGWSGLAPIQYFIKHLIGIRLDAHQNMITWRINELGRHGIEGIYLGEENNVSLIAQERNSLRDEIVIYASCSEDFSLKVITDFLDMVVNVQCGEGEFTQITIPPASR